MTREEWLDSGEFRDAHEPEIRTAMARELARFVELATASPARPRRPLLRPEGALWPKPHNALFDFEKTAAGAEWIDEIGAAARTITDRGVGREVVGHSDFSVKHLRFDPDLTATALYDWDSVDTDLEPVVVGTAAGSFTYTEELAHEIVVWPSLEESRAFWPTTSMRVVHRSPTRSAPPHVPRASICARTGSVADMPSAATRGRAGWRSLPACSSSGARGTRAGRSA